MAYSTNEYFSKYLNLLKKSIPDIYILFINLQNVYNWAVFYYQIVIIQPLALNVQLRFSLSLDPVFAQLFPLFFVFAFCFFILGPYQHYYLSHHYHHYHIFFANFIRDINIEGQNPKNYLHLL